MKRNEYVNFCQTRKSKGKSILVTGLSVTDPTFARTGRQLIFNPLNIEYRMKYPDGVPLNKENPLQFNEFDKLYPDTFKAIQQAKSTVKDTNQKVKDYKAQQAQQAQPA